MKYGRIVSRLVCLSLIVFSGAAAGDVRLPAVIGGNMVLQQQAEAAIWGWADAGERVTVRGSWGAQAAKATADATGKWKTTLKTPAAGGPHTVTIEGKNTVTLHNVLIGEVWVGSGQSNMEWEVRQADNARQETRRANIPEIRLFQVPRVTAQTPRDDVEASWVVCTPETVEGFSAVSYFFGRELHEELNVPVGLIHTSWGGTPAEAWTSEATLREQFPEFGEGIDVVKNPAQHMERLRRENERRIGAYEEAIARFDTGTQQNWQNPGLDTGDWKEMELPRTWSGTDLADVDGVVWFRRVTNLPPSWARSDLELHLGPIDDIDTVWVNGRRIGTTSGWDLPRVYRIPASALRVGPNVIAVRVIDTFSEGGFGGTEEQMRIGPVGADAKACATVARTWQYKVSAERLPRELPGLPVMGTTPYNQNSPTTLYNAMLAPLMPYRIAGAIWYQGESNVGRHDQYAKLFPAMITDWRKHWGIGAFPFYYVQIAPYDYGDASDPASALLREAQLKTLSAVENVGMAVTMDIGEERDIHPRNKQDVGRRLALCALANDYGRDVVCHGPIYREMEVEDAAVRLSFDHADGGLVAKGGELTGFAVAGEDKVFVPAKAVIDGETIVVSSEQVANPVAVRYAFTNWARPNLFNGAGLPASSFRTDDWK